MNSKSENLIKIYWEKNLMIEPQKIVQIFYEVESYPKWIPSIEKTQIVNFFFK